MNVNRAAINLVPSSDWLASHLRTARMAAAALALFGCLSLVSVVAGTDEPPGLPTELVAPMDATPLQIKTVSVRGCEKMGLAPSENREDLGKSIVAKVPVPVSSQPLRATQTDRLAEWPEYRLDPPEPPLDLMIFETPLVSMSLSDSPPTTDVDANLLAGARVFAIVRPSDPNDTEAISVDRHEPMDSTDPSGIEPVSKSASASTRIFEFTAVSGNVEPIDPSILQLPQIFQVAEVRVVPSTASSRPNRTGATTRSTIRRRTQFVAARTQPPAAPANANDPMAALGFTPLTQLSVDTALQANPEVSPELQEPESDAGQHFANFGQYDDIPVLGHIGLNPDFFLQPGDFCHQPLYFEEINLERFGTTFTPRLQPVVSGARFFVTVPAMPYLMTVYRPRVCYQDMSPYRPGRPAPWHRELPPLQLNAATVEAALIAGMFFVIP